MALPNESNDPGPNSQAQMQAGGPHRQSLNDAPMPNSIPLQLQQQQVPLNNGGIALLPGGAHDAQAALSTYQSNQRILESQQRTLTAQNIIGKQLQVMHLQQQINNPLELQDQPTTEPIDLTMTAEPASVAAPTATDLDDVNQKPMMSQAASVAPPSATDLDDVNQRPMMAQAASVAAPTATDLDGANQRPMMAQAASVAAPTATNLDGANQKPMMAQAASVAAPTATDLDDVNQRLMMAQAASVATPTATDLDGVNQRPMMAQAASVAAPTATDLDGVNQRPMMAQAASVATPTATDLDGVNQRPMMAQEASVATPTATDLDGVNQRPMMAQAASVATPTATDLDGVNQRPMMAQAASVATPTATDLDDVNQSDQLERMSRVAEEKKLQSTLQSIAPAPPPQKQSVPVNEPDVHAAAVAKPTHGVIQEKRTASAAAKTCESVQQQAKQAATAASHQAVPVVENQPTNGAQSGLQRVRQILPAVEAKKLAAKKPAPPTQRHETGERPFQRRTLFAPVGPHPQAASVAKKPLTSAIEPERTTANGSAPLNGKSVSFPTNNGQAGNQEAAYVRVKKRKATAELGKGRVTPEVEIIEVRQAQKLPQNARLHRKVTPQEPLAVPMHGTPWRFDPKAVAARATTAPHNIAPHPANVNAYYQHQVKVHQAQVHQAQVHQAQLHQAQVHQAQALQQQRLLQRQQLLHMQGQPWPPQRQQETLHQQDRTMAGLIRYDIGPSFVPLGPPQLPVLYRSFYNLKSEVGAVFQAIGLLVMNARDPYKVSPQTKPSYALTASYHDFKIHLTPSQPEKTQKTCSKIVYALTCHACFLKGAVNNGRCCSSSVYFPDDAKSFQKHFYTLKLHLMSCPNVSASLKGYLFGTKRQLPNLVGETNRRLPGFRGTASEPAFLRQMCESYGLFEPNADPSRHRLETIVKERIYNDNVGAMEDALKTTSMTLRGVIGEGVCDVVDADIVNDDPFCLFVFECLEVIRIYRQRSLPEYRRLFNHKSVQDDDNELFMLQCQCCHGRRKDGSFNQEAVVLMNDGGQCSENLMRMIFDHFGTCFSSHRLQKLNILRIDPIAEHEQFSHFAVSIHKHIVSLITWARGVQEASPTEPPSCDQELWKSISIEQFRELLNTWNTIPVSNLLGPKKPDGSPGSAVLDCVGFPKIGILHGKIETPTVNDLKTTFRKRGPQPPELTSRRAINKRAARPSSKALDVEVLPAVLSPKAHKYLKDNTVVLLDNL